MWPQCSKLPCKMISVPDELITGASQPLARCECVCHRLRGDQTPSTSTSQRKKCLFFPSLTKQQLCLEPRGSGRAPFPFPCPFLPPDRGDIAFIHLGGRGLTMPCGAAGLHWALSATATTASFYPRGHAGPSPSSCTPWGCPLPVSQPWGWAKGEPGERWPRAQRANSTRQSPINPHGHGLPRPQPRCAAVSEIKEASLSPNKRSDLLSRRDKFLQPSIPAEHMCPRATERAGSSPWPISPSSCWKRPGTSP